MSIRPAAFSYPCEPHPTTPMHSLEKQFVRLAFGGISSFFPQTQSTKSVNSKPTLSALRFGETTDRIYLISSVIVTPCTACSPFHNCLL